MTTGKFLLNFIFLKFFCLKLSVTPRLRPFPRRDGCLFYILVPHVQWSVKMRNPPPYGMVSGFICYIISYMILQNVAVSGRRNNRLWESAFLFLPVPYGNIVTGCYQVQCHWFPHDTTSQETNSTSLKLVIIK